jgi:hypothetical protein
MESTALVVDVLRACGVEGSRSRVALEAALAAYGITLARGGEVATAIARAVMGEYIGTNRLSRVASAGRELKERGVNDARGYMSQRGQGVTALAKAWTARNSKVGELPEPSPSDPVELVVRLTRGAYDWTRSQHIAFACLMPAPDGSVQAAHLASQNDFFGYVLVREKGTLSDTQQTFLQTAWRTFPRKDGALHILRASDEAWDVLSAGGFQCLVLGHDAESLMAQVPPEK